MLMRTKTLLAQLLATLLALSAQGTSAAPAAAATKTALTITADLADGATPYKWTLTCDPLGGKHPNRKAACALLAKQGRALFAPVPADAACTMIFGGLEQVKIVGLVKGKKVNALFTRTDGCQIARYERAMALFTIPGSVVVRGQVSLDDQPADGTVIFISDRRQVSSKATAGQFAVRLTEGTWLGSASAGARACTPIVITVPGELPPLPLIACKSSTPPTS